MRVIIRTLSFFEQWAAEILRQPALMFTLVIAPFLLLLAFGDGVKIGGPRPRTIIVQPPGSQQPIEPLLENLEEEVEIVGITESLPLARRALEKGDVDAVAVIPEDPNAFIEKGERVPIEVLIGEIDPVRRSYARGYLNDQVALLNQRTIAEVLREAQAGLSNVGEITSEARGYLNALRSANGRLDEARRAVDQLQAALAPLDSVTSTLQQAAAVSLIIPGLSRSQEDIRELQTTITELQSSVGDIDRQLNTTDGEASLPSEAEIREIETRLDELDQSSGSFDAINPDVLSAPFFLRLQDVTPIEPTFTAFYSPGVLALLVQHLAVTVAALTMARMRLLRVTDLLRVAPIRTIEVIIGNYLSYALLCGVAAAALLGLLAAGLNVPVIGSYAFVALAIGLLIVCSLGVGFLASQLSSSVQQAAQIAMLLLLASIFFGGFAFSLDRIDWPVRAISYLLPATYGIRTLQDVMLRGFEPRIEDLAALAGGAAVLFVLNVFLLSRELRATK